jgi:primosomal protein N''
MRIILILLIAILSFSCSQKDPRIDKFENVLGERQSNALSALVSDFENNLVKLYPDLSIEQSYRQYLADMLSDSISDGRIARWTDQDRA